MMARRIAIRAGAAALAVGSLALAGCDSVTAPPSTAAVSAPPSSAAPAPASSSAAPAPASSSDAVPSDTGGSYPEGASAETPECQSASPAALAAVNAAMTIPDYVPDPAAEPFTLFGLTATPDPEHAVWLLSGTIQAPAGSEGRLVVWATTADPTRPEFAGTLRSIGGQTAQISSAPALDLTGLEHAGGMPPAALRCLAAPRP